MVESTEASRQLENQPTSKSTEISPSKEGPKTSSSGKNYKKDVIGSPGQPPGPHDVTCGRYGTLDVGRNMDSGHISDSSHDILSLVDDPSDEDTDFDDNYDGNKMYGNPKNTTSGSRLTKKRDKNGMKP